MTTEWSQTCRRVIVVVIAVVIAVGMLNGCASVFQDLDDTISRKRFKSDDEALGSARAFYDQGNYAVALDRFQTLADTSASHKIARRAWLGEICCRLMLADTHAAYTIAIGMWHEFENSATDKDSAWELALLDPLIVYPPSLPPPEAITDSSAAQPTAEDETTADRQPQYRQTRNRQIQAERVALEKKAQRADQLQHQLNKIAAENRSLKEKIKALEAIDQNIQKKKTEIAAPSE